MSDLFWLTDGQVARLEQGYLHQAKWVTVARCALLNTAHKTLYNRWKRWSDKGVFARMMAGLAAGQDEHDHDRRDLFQGPPDSDQLRRKKGAWAPD